ncbi:MAG: hypothetical protein ABI388_08500 [Bacteroidia bacterium]
MQALLKKYFILLFFYFNLSCNFYAQQGCTIDRASFKTLPEIYYKNEQETKAVFSCKIINSLITENGDAYSIGEIQEVYFGRTVLKQVKILTGHFIKPPLPKPPTLLIPPPKPIIKNNYDVPYSEDGLIDIESFSHSPQSWGIKMMKDSVYLIYANNDTAYNQSYDYRCKQFKKTPDIKNEIEMLKTFGGIFNEKKSGHFIFKNEKGILLAEGSYKKGKLLGVWKNYSTAGQLFSWEDFELNEYKSFYFNGNLKEKITHYKDSSVTKNYFDNPKSQVYLKTVTPKNDTSSNIIIYEYYTTGVLKEKHEEHNYRYNGLYWEFYPNGKVETISEYSYHPQNYRNGIYQQYYSNGQLKLDAHVINARRVGCWIWYNEDGSFMAEWDYTDGKAPQ